MKNERTPYLTPAIDLLLTPTDVIMNTLDQGGDDDEAIWQMLMNGVDFTQNT